jgi:hypothetical protein
VTLVSLSLYKSVRQPRQYYRKQGIRKYINIMVCSEMSNYIQFNKNPKLVQNY